MEAPVLTVIDILQHTKDIHTYSNFSLAFVNDHVIRVGIMTESFYWHLHPSFLVIEGSIFIDLKDRTIELFPGQLFTIPKNVKHRTRPNGDRSVNLTFESQDMETLKME